jgi:hypothetical protein
MDIDWMALVKVALVSFAFGVGLVAVFSLGIVGTAAGAPESARQQANGGGAASASLGRSTGRLLAVLCFGLCGAAVLYGLWLIIAQFH